MPLTPRQIDVLNALADGLPRKEIGVRLGISVRTVKAYLHQVIHTLNLNEQSDDRFWPSLQIALWWTKLPELGRIGVSVASNADIREHFWNDLKRRRG